MLCGVYDMHGIHFSKVSSQKFQDPGIPRNDGNVGHVGEEAGRWRVASVKCGLRQVDPFESLTLTLTFNVNVTVSWDP